MSSPLPVNGAITHQGQVLPVSHRVPSSAPLYVSPISKFVSVLLCSSPDKTKLHGWLQLDITGTREVLHSLVLTQEEKHDP